jgi:hypothetical protein
MPRFVWKCEHCNKITKRILDKRPSLDKCECGGAQKFVTNTSSQTMEVIDNGLMAKAVERPVGIEEKIAERNALADSEKV